MLYVGRFFIFWTILCRNLSESCELFIQDVHSHSLSLFNYTASVYIHSVNLEPAGGSVAVCVHDSIVITCTISSTQILSWTLHGPKNNNVFDTEVYISSSSLDQERMLGDFVLRLKSTSPLVSTATLNDTAPKHNGSLLTCANTGADDPLPEQFTDMIIHVKGTNFIMRFT